MSRVFVDLLDCLAGETPFPFSTKACHIECAHSNSTHSKSLSIKLDHYENKYSSYIFLFYFFCTLNQTLQARWPGWLGKIKESYHVGLQDYRTIAIC